MQSLFNSLCFFLFCSTTNASLLPYRTRKLVTNSRVWFLRGLMDCKVQGEGRRDNAQNLQKADFLLNSTKITVTMAVVKCRKTGPGKLGNLHHWRCQKLHLTKAKNELITAGLVSELDGQNHPVIPNANSHNTVLSSPLKAQIRTFSSSFC